MNLYIVNHISFSLVEFDWRRKNGKTFIAQTRTTFQGLEKDLKVYEQLEIGDQICVEDKKYIWNGNNLLPTIISDYLYPERYDIHWTFLVSTILNSQVSNRLFKNIAARKLIFKGEDNLFLSSKFRIGKRRYIIVFSAYVSLQRRTNSIELIYPFQILPISTNYNFYIQRSNRKIYIE